MFSHSIKLFKIFGIEVEIHISWFIIFLLIVWTLATAYFPYYYHNLSSDTYWIMGVAAAILLFVSVLLHELSHSLVAKKNGLSIKKITLFIFGGVAHMSNEPPDASTEFKMAIAGPLCSIFLMLFFLLLGEFIKSMYLWIPIYAVVRYLSIINGMLAGFNLIPGFPLDGGRVLRAVIWKWTKNLKRATWIVSNIGKVVAFLLVALGLLNILFGYNFIGGIWLIFIGFFLHQAATTGYMQVSLRQALSGVLAKDIMKKDVITVYKHMNLNELINEYFLRYKYKSFPVIEDDKVVGMVDLNSIKEINKDKWINVTVNEVMNNSVDKISVTPHQEAVLVMNKLMRNDIGKVLVIDRGKHLLGILTRKDIIQLLSLKTDLGI